MTDIYKNNLSAQIIIAQAVRRSNKPLNKYNTGMHMATEELTGEPSDRNGSDAGNDPEPLQEHE